MNPDKYKSIGNGFAVTVREDGFRGLAKGWAPTFIGYSMQGLCKFGFYEVFKILYSDLLGEVSRTFWHLTGNTCQSRVGMSCFWSTEERWDEFKGVLWVFIDHEAALSYHIILEKSELPFSCVQMECRLYVTCLGLLLFSPTVCVTNRRIRTCGEPPCTWLPQLVQSSSLTSLWLQWRLPKSVSRPSQAMLTPWESVPPRCMQRRASGRKFVP